MKTSFCFLALFLVSYHLTSGQRKPTTIFHDDFASYSNGSDGSPMWTPAKGVWQVIDGKYLQQSTEYDCASLLEYDLNESFELDVTFEQIDGDLGAGVVFSSYQRDNLTYAQLARFDGAATFITGYYQNGEFNTTSSAKTDSLDLKKQHSFTLIVDRDRDAYSMSVDGKKILDNIPIMFRSGYCGLQSSAGRVAFKEVALHRLPMKSKPSELDWVQRFAITPDGQFLVPNERKGIVQIFDDKGQLVKTIGQPASQKGQLHGPNAVAFLDDSTIVVSDRESNQLYLFGMDGAWKRSACWQGSGRGTLNNPAAVAVNSRRQIFVVEKENHRVQVFDDSLHAIAEFGNSKLVAPMDVAVQDSSVYVLNTGLSQIEVYTWNGSKATWREMISYGGGEGRGLAVREGWIYLSLVNEVQRYSIKGEKNVSFKGRSIDFILPWGIGFHLNVYGIYRSGYIFVADFLHGRILALTSLYDPTPFSNTPQDTTEATISCWGGGLYLEKKEQPRAIVTIGQDTIGQDTIARLFVPKESQDNRINLKNLRPNTTYHVRFWPTVKTIPPRKEYSRPYAFTTGTGSSQRKLIARLPMIALIFANVVDDKNINASAPPQPLLPDSEIIRIKNQIADGVRFYWIHSKMNLFLDMEYLVIPEIKNRSELYGNEWWYPPKDSVLESCLRNNGKEIKNYSGILYLTCTQTYDTTLHKYILAGKGGAFTNGVGTGKGYGISWWDVTRRNHNAGNNWLFVHEFNHQLDDIFLASGYPEYWFNHISPTIGTAAKFGEHFDANAYILRNVPVNEWFDLKYTSLIVVNDSDGDGIPDPEPRLPLDEARVGANPNNGDTDGDNWGDLGEFYFSKSNWVTEGWGETYGGRALFPNLHKLDTDDDGIPDRDDPYSCYPFKPEIRYGSPAIGSTTETQWNYFAELHDPKIDATVYASWDSGKLAFRFEMDRNAPVKLMLDGNDDGWFLGRENYLITLTPKSDSIVAQHVQIFNATDPNKWPFMDDALGEKIRLQSSLRKENGKYWLDVVVPRNDDLGFRLNPQNKIGVLVGFLCSFDEDGNKRYVDIFEPNTFFDVRLVR